MIVHDLKVWPAYFEKIILNEKTFELRKDDCGFKVGDRLRLREWDPRVGAQDGAYTGREVFRDVTYMLRGPSSYLAEGYCALGIRPPETREERREHLLQLLAETVGPPIALRDPEGVGFVSIFSRDPIQFGASANVVARVQVSFRPRRLVILEPRFEVVENELIEEHADFIRKPPRWKFWRDPVVERHLTSQRTVQHRRFIEVPRGVWDVHGVYCGSRPQFLSSDPIRGDAFAPDGALDFDGLRCEVGMEINVQVRCAAPDLVGGSQHGEFPFRAVLLGMIEHPLRESAPLFSDDENLNDLVERVRALVVGGQLSANPSDEERISWAAGQLALSRPDITIEQAREIARRAVEEEK